MEDRNDFRDYLFLVLYSLACFVSLIGNGLVCKLILTSAKMRTFTNLLLGSMAVSDFICGLSFPFRLLFCWDTFLTQYGPTACLLNKGVQLLTFQLSSVVMVVIAIDRLVLFQSPFKKREFSVWWLVGLTWLVSAVIIVGTSPALAFTVYFSEDTLMTCALRVVFASSPLVQRIQLIIANLAHFWVPLVITSVCYVKIGILVWNRKVGDLVMDAWISQKWKTIKMLIAVVIAFFMSWFPFFIHNLVLFIRNPGQKRPCDQSYGFLISVWLAFTSCCYNPIIYWWMNPDYRNGMKRIYSCNLNQVWKRHQASSSTQTQSATVFRISK